LSAPAFQPNVGLLRLPTLTRIRAQTISPADIVHRAIERRAVEAVNWGLPAVNYDRMVQAMLGAKGAFNQIVFWSGFSDWKNQTLTPNPDTIYLQPFFDTKDVGPIVIEIPPAGEAGSITGTIMDCWQAALEDVGPAGADKGKGGKYLILPPGYNGVPPEGYIVLPSQTYRAMRCSVRSSKGAEARTSPRRLLTANRSSSTHCRRPPTLRRPSLTT